MKKFQFRGPLKYRNTPTSVDGWRFDSIVESERYRELVLLKSQGTVIHIEIHPVFRLTPDITYKADFLVIYKSHLIEVEDVKSAFTVKNRDFIIKRKLFDSTHPFAPLSVLIRKKGRK